jgi:hypothetical protein
MAGGHDKDDLVTRPACPLNYPPPRLGFRLTDNTCQHHTPGHGNSGPVSESWNQRCPKLEATRPSFLPPSRDLDIGRNRRYFKS